MKAIGLVLLSCLATTPAHGQSSFQVPSNLYLLRGTSAPPASTLYFPDSSKGAPDYRYEGALAGAVLLGAGGWLAGGLCEDTGCPSRASYALGGALIGGLFGLLIGGMITKN